KRATLPYLVEWSSGLQWGRHRSVAEIHWRHVGLSQGARASMGPRPIGRGNVNAWRRPPGARRGFNGAATDRSRKFAPLGKERHTDGEASMGPRPIGRGNPSAAAPSSASAALQWGRDRSVAEMLVRDEAPGPVAHASMGPRPIGRGNVRIPRGRGGAPPWLQWGRDRSVAEIIPKLDGRLRADLLQWGRDRSVAEMVLGGPIDHDERGRLQWGRDRSVAEIQGRWPEGEPAIALQWGRDRSVAEIRTDQ